MMFETRIGQLRERWERLSPRERMLLSIMGGTFVLLITLVSGYFINDGLATVEEANQDARQALRDLDTQRESYLRAKAKAADTERRMGKTPVQLQGFLEQVGKDAGVDVAEFTEIPPQTSGKFVDRSATIRLNNVTLDTLAAFLRGVETGQNLVVVTALSVKTRDDKHQELEVEMTVTTYEHASDKKDKSGSKKGDKT